MNNKAEDGFSYTKSTKTVTVDVSVILEVTDRVETFLRRVVDQRELLWIKTTAEAARLSGELHVARMTLKAGIEG